jgi:hypothetical protein
MALALNIGFNTENVVFYYVDMPTTLKFDYTKKIFKNIFYCQPVKFDVISNVTNSSAIIKKLFSSMTYWHKDHIHKNFLGQSCRRNK